MAIAVVVQTKYYEILGLWLLSFVYFFGGICVFLGQGFPITPAGLNLTDLLLYTFV